MHCNIRKSRRIFPSLPIMVGTLHWCMALGHSVRALLPTLHDNGKWTRGHTGRATSRQPIQLDGRWNPRVKNPSLLSKKHPILEHCAGRTGSTSTSITCDMTRPQRVTRSVAIIHRTVNRVQVPGPFSWTSDRYRLYINEWKGKRLLLSPCLDLKNISQNIWDSRPIKSLDTCMKH
jgi:hypothetical protein